MSKKRSRQHALTQAKSNEKKFVWPLAIKFYTKIQTNLLKEEDFLEAAEVQEKIGYCLRMYAFQADTQEKFKKRINLAIKAYRKAHGLYDKLSNKQKNARKLRCIAITKYLGYWIVSDPSEKRKFLDQSLELESKALEAFSESGAMLEYTRTYNELSPIFFYRIFLEWDRPTLLGILEKGIKWGEQAIESLPKHRDLYETARAYFALATCLSDLGFYLIAESEDIDKYRLKAIEYLKKTIEISEKNEDAFLLGLSHLWLGINSGGEEAMSHHKKTMEYAKKTRHGFLIANGLDFLAYDNYWKAYAKENPEKRIRLAEKAMQFYEKAQHHYSIISFISPRGGFIGPPSGQAEHYYQLALWETSSDKRLMLLKKAEELGVRALKLAKSSDMPLVIAQVFHVMSKILQAQARTLSNRLEKKTRLETALKHREKTVEIFGSLNPNFYWNLGVMLNYLAGIKAELSEIESDLDKKGKLLREAVLSKKKCLEYCTKVMLSLERKGETSLFAALHEYQDTYVTLLLRLYNLTGKLRHLKKVVETLQEAIESALKSDMVSRVARSYWKLAKTQDVLGDNLQAARNFQHASENYLEAAKKILQLKIFFQDHASYMKAWVEIEKAKINHSNREYGQAKENYEKAADLHKSTKQWNYLSSNYFAWARLEEAEDLSRREQIKPAIQQFENSAKLFHKAKRVLKGVKDGIEDEDEKDLATRLIKASSIREEYCLGRIALEQAKNLSRIGSHEASSRKYSSAITRFQNLLNIIESEASFSNATVTKDRQELKPIIYLCRAWKMMARAEAEASPELYLEASKLFETAKESSDNEKVKLMTLGHSRFCRALYSGTKFEDSRETKLYISATQDLESAANYYVRAGFKVAAEYATATQRLLDAYVYITNAKKEADPGKKAKYYRVAEKVLQVSMGAYLKAKHPAKTEQVKKLLEKIREERELVVSLSEILMAPAITTSTTSFVTPSPSEETAAGLERFEHANIQTKIILDKSEIKLGEDFKLNFQITNIGKQTILVDEVKEFLPPGFQLIDKPSYGHFEDLHLSINGKRVDPLKTLKIKLILRAFGAGVFDISPKIVYVDYTGHQQISEPESVTIKVSTEHLPNRVTTGYEPLDDLLFGGIPKNYAVVLTSSSCDERDLIVKKFLESGIRKGQITFYATTKVIETEKFTEELQLNFYMFICNPQADMISRSAPSLHGHMFKFKGVENLTDINIAITSAMRKLNTSIEAPKRCCIQIISDVLLQHKALQTRRWLTGLLPELKSRGFITLAVMDLDMHSLQEARAVLDLFEGEISINEKTDKEITGKSLVVKRMARQKFSKREISL